MHQVVVSTYPHTLPETYIVNALPADVSEIDAHHCVFYGQIDFVFTMLPCYQFHSIFKFTQFYHISTQSQVQ